jgi:serine/threonine protein kinase/TolA-binding protein
MNLLPGPASDPRSGDSFSDTPPFADGEASLAVRLAGEMARCWRRGERPRAEDFLARHPELWDDPDNAVDLVYEEICLREEAGEASPAEEVLARFPQWRPQLELLLECHRVLDPERTAPRFPAVGEELDGFRLEAELGRGARGRVFLAVQPELGERPVVLKVTPCEGQEHLSLARLQHTNIVPLYSAHEDPRRNLRVLCMPYFGGATLARVLQRLHDRPVEDRDGSDLLRALDAEARAAPPPGPSHCPGRRYLAHDNYVPAVCWLGAYLADALEHAHERGLLHLDVKPSNVLLAADGTPMLLDFHLALPPVRPGDLPPERLGGTPAYMAPEQRAAVRALTEGRPIAEAVDRRTDVYALGLLLYEALGGPVPLPPGRLPRLDRLNPAVSAGLADIVALCLADDPGRRYGTAADLAGDLRRHRQDLPLQGVPNRLGERLRKWRRRQQRWTFRLILCGGAVVLLAAALAGVAVLFGTEQAALGDQAQARAEAAAAAQEAAEHDQAVRDLHRLATDLRFATADSHLLAPAETLDESCRRLWERRRAILHGLDQESPGEREAIRADLLDVVLLWTDMRKRRAGADTSGAIRRQTDAVRAEAETLVGSDPALGAELAETAAGHYVRGRSLYQDGDLAGADDAFLAACRLDPQAVWPRFYHGVCAYRRKDYEEAARAFGACAALARTRDEAARHLFNRAKALADDDRLEPALDSYDLALAYNPGLALAAFNRALVKYRLRRYAEALADLQRAQDGGVRPASVWYHRAVVQQAQGDRTAALASAEEALRRAPDNEAVRRLRDGLRRRR